MNRDSSTDRLREELRPFIRHLTHQDIALDQMTKIIDKASTNRAIEELENLREQVKHENLRTISQVINTMVDELRRSLK